MSVVRLLVCIFFLLLKSPLFSQRGIAGIWEGKFLTNEAGLGQPKLVVEIYDVKDSSFSGITHLYYEGQKYEHYKMIGWYSKKDSLLVFREASTIAVDLGIYGNCLGTYMMSLKRAGKNLYQNGYWMPNITGCTTSSIVWLQQNMPEPPKTVSVVKPKPPVGKEQKPAVVKEQPAVKPLNKQTEPVIVTAPPATPAAPQVIKKTAVVLPEKIAKRETDIQSLLEIAPAEKDSIKVEVYDNGDIDGDTVSVYYGEALIIDKQLITAKPLTFYVSLNKKTNPISHLRLVAESLGSIPPCTALMIVTTKSKRYEVRLASSFKKNATVELFLKE